jgi:hypothetical protein
VKGLVIGCLAAIGFYVVGMWFFENFPTFTLLLIASTVAGAWLGALAWAWKR